MKNEPCFKFLNELSQNTQLDMNLIRRRSLQTIAEIGDLRDCIVSLSKEKLTSKQFHLGKPVVVMLVENCQIKFFSLLVQSRASIEESLLVDPSIRCIFGF